MSEDAGAFPGFPGFGARYTGVPDAFFTRLLPEIEDPHELKALLFVFWRLRGRPGQRRHVTLSELSAIPTVLGVFGAEAEAARTRLSDALDALVRRGALIEVTVARAAPDEPERVYFLNTPADARRARRLREGEWTLPAHPRGVIELARRRRPAVFAAWERRIGLLTPEIARRIEAAVAAHGEAAVLAAIEEAAERAEHPWRYVSARLDRLGTEREVIRREEPA